jgi:predicted RNA-binding Zn-ribbon protein involved in translation (DUF1610 family)
VRFKAAKRVRCPQCGGDDVTREMWGWVDPSTGKYVRRLLGFRFDTLGLCLVMLGPGIAYLAFYLVAVPGYLIWRLATWRRYSERRQEFICEQCGFGWCQTEGEADPEPGLVLA